MSPSSSQPSRYIQTALGQREYYPQPGVPLGICISLVDALGVEDEEVTLDATLVGDLGIQSIDFLDIIFRLEKAYATTIPRQELFPSDILSDKDNFDNGRLNEKGIARLQERLPFMDLSHLRKDSYITDFNSMLTVGDIKRYLQSKQLIPADE